MSDAAQAAMLAALNDGSAITEWDVPLGREWAVVSLTDSGVMFEACTSEAGAYLTHQRHYASTPAHVVSRLGGWRIDV